MRQEEFQYISIVLNLTYNKNKLCKTLENWSWDKLQFDFLEKRLGIVPLSHFMYDFSRKMFLMLYSTEQTSLPNCLYFLRYWSICVLRLFVNQIVTLYILKLTMSFLSRGREELLRWNKKNLSSFLKGFQLPKIVSDLRERLFLLTGAQFGPILAPKLSFSCIDTILHHFKVAKFFSKIFLLFGPSLRHSKMAHPMV